MQIRLVEPDEYARLGAITLHAYTALPGHVAEPEYEAELYDVRTRAEAPATSVLVAAEDDGTLLGGVTFVEDSSSPMAEHGVEGAASFRMLAVDPAAQGRGVGEALVRACIERARALGCHAVVMHSGTWMAGAHRLYDRLGFERDPDLDWSPVPGIDLLAFRLTFSRQ